MTKCKLKNGAEASLKLATEIFNLITDLIENENDISLLNGLLGEMYKMANDDQHRISNPKAQKLIKMGLVQPDGTMTEENKNIIQSSFFTDAQWDIIFTQNPIETELNGDHTDPS